jgi:hypothetical protein
MTPYHFVRTGAVQIGFLPNLPLDAECATNSPFCSILRVICFEYCPILTAVCLSERRIWAKEEASEFIMASCTVENVGYAGYVELAEPAGLVESGRWA